MDNNMERFSRELRNFEAVWKRVGAVKSASAAAEARGVTLKPGAKRSGGARFSQGRR